MVEPLRHTSHASRRSPVRRVSSAKVKYRVYSSTNMYALARGRGGGSRGQCAVGHRSPVHGAILPKVVPYIEIDEPENKRKVTPQEITALRFNRSHNNLTIRLSILYIVGPLFRPNS